MPGRSARIVPTFRAALESARQKRGIALAAMLSALVLAGCATQYALRDARTLIANGQAEAALGRYQEALILDPNNAELRSAYAQTRERVVRTFLEQADRLLEAGRRDESEKTYRRVLAIDPRNDRARSGILAIAREVRHAELLNSAAAELEQKNVESPHERRSEPARRKEP
jgi:general secretion pathway protein D